MDSGSDRTPPPPQPQSEYERLLQALRPALHGRSPAAIMPSEAAELAARLGIDARLLELLSDATRLAQQAGLPAEAVYGGVRRLGPLDLDRLLATDPTLLRQALEEAIQTHISPASLRGALDTVLARMAQLQRQRSAAPQHDDWARREVAGQLLDTTTHAPLAGFTVHAFDVDSAAAPRDLGSTTTDKDGFFVLTYTADRSSSPDENGRRFRLHLLDPAGREMPAADVLVIARQDQILRVTARQDLILEVRVHTPPVSDAPSPSLTDLASSAHLSVPPPLLEALAARGIRTLDELRGAGGIGQLAGLPVPPDHPAVQALEAHANLSVLSADVPLNAALIARGYPSLAAIAGATRANFVVALHDQASEVKAAQLHAMASAMTHALDNVTMELRSSKANGFFDQHAVSPGTNPAAAAMLATPCGCADCASAVSPAAYLADLLNYTLMHVTNNGTPLTLSDLTSLFHQPFGDLPTDCEAVDQQVRQVRLCVEVLRQYFQAKPLPALGQDKEQHYRWEAYQTLLVQLGTSSAEIRLARSASLQTRQVVADRLGFDLGPEAPDALQALLLDPAAPAAPADQLHALTEQALERLFGLADTTRNPLSDGALVSNPYGQITRWNLSGIEWGRNTDGDGLIYVRLSHPTASLFKVELFQDAARTRLVADGLGSSAKGAVSLIERGGSGLAGTITISYAAGGGDILLAAVPAVWSWRLQHLRTLWGLQDRPTDPYTAGESLAPLAQLPQGLQFPPALAAHISYDADDQALVFDGVMDTDQVAALLALSTEPDYQAAIRSLFQQSQRLPLIDPDLIGPDDFRAPFAQPDPGGADQAFDLWLKRRAWVDLRLQALASLTKVVGSATVPDLAALVGAMAQPVTYAGVSLIPWATAPQVHALATLATQVSAGVDVETTTRRIQSELALSVEALTRLMAIAAKDQLAALDMAGEGVQPEEWDEVYSILVQAQKTRFAAAWRSEEEDQGVLLGAETFWIALREPQPGNWPPALPDATHPHPIIDPELLTLNDLPDAVAGRRARALWSARDSQLAQITAQLQETRESQGFEAMLRRALGEPGTTDPLPPDVDLAALLVALSDNDPAVVAAATAQIANELYMTPAAFIRLMAIKAKHDDPQPAAKPTAAEWAEVYALLTTAQKAHRVYSTWEQEEQLAGVDVAYWRARKAALPRWRAAAETRLTWQRALLTRSGAPIVDPDLIGPEYLRDPMSGHPAADLWQERNDWITAHLASLKGQITGAQSPWLVELDATAVGCLLDPTTVPGTQADLKALRETGGLDAVLVHLWGDPLPELAALLDDLTGGSASLQASARRTIALSLYLGAADFEQFMQIRAKDQAQNPQASVTVAEWETVDAILTRAALAQSVFGLDDARQQGNDIAPRLDQLLLAGDAFTTLLQLRRLVASNATGGDPLLTSEWDDVFSILLQVQKRRAFAVWRKAERAAKLVLGPDHFQLPVPPAAAYPPPEVPPPPAWRGTAGDRSGWQQIVLSRVDEQRASIEALREANAVAEERALPRLRDALILAAGTASLGLAANAEEITQLLLIDARIDSCQMTTRIAQAIETLQTLLFALRTSQLDAYPQLALEADYFDAEWEWMGSYATWRAAMLVFLYPENVLLPSVRARTRQTPAFQALVDTSRGDWTFDLQAACQAVHDYAAYFRDVCNLTIEATCNATTHLAGDDCAGSNGAARGYRDLFYLFARSTVSNTLYFSTIDEARPSGYAQSFWTPITVSGLSKIAIKAIIGAVPYERSAQERHIYLFLQPSWDEHPEVDVLTFDLETPGWVSGVQTLALDLPDATTATSYPSDLGDPLTLSGVFAVQRVWADVPPTLVVVQKTTYGGSSLVYIRSLNAAGDGWQPSGDSSTASTGWDAFQYKVPLPPGTVVFATLQAQWRHLGQGNYGERDDNWVLCLGGDSVQSSLAIFSDPGGSANTWTVDGQWRGATPCHDSRAISILVSQSGQNVRQVAVLQDHETGLRPAVAYEQSLTGVVPYFGTMPYSPELEGQRHLVHQLDYAQNTSLATKSGFYDFLLDTKDTIQDDKTDDEGEVWTEVARTRVTPTVGNPATQAPPFAFDITEQLTADDVQQKRATIATWYPANELSAGGTATTLTYLEEAYYFVPVQLALQLQKHGYFQEALDWFRTVYDYAAPLAVQKIYYGLVAEEQLSTGYQRAVGWLLDPLNPHAIAATRRGAYTRFTLQAIVRCLLDFADDDATRDTPESRPQARTLYLTALRLLDLPGLKQHLGQCDDLIGTLMIDLTGQLQLSPALIGQLTAGLSTITTFEALDATIGGVKAVLAGTGSLASRLEQARDTVAAARAKQRPPTLGDIVDGKRASTAALQAALLAEPAVAEVAKNAGQLAGQDVLHGVAAVSGASPMVLRDKPTNMPWLGEKAGTNLQLQRWVTALSVPPNATSVPAAQFCIPANPVLAALRLHAEVNLFKLRTCRNIAGLVRAMEPYAAPTTVASGLPTFAGGDQLMLMPFTRRPALQGLPPTAYRYPVVIERAKQLVGVAQQVESAFLAMLEKGDAERYSRLKAQQDVTLTRAGVALQNLRFIEAQAGVALAQLQQQRAQFQVDHYQDLLDEGISTLESLAIGQMVAAAALETGASIVNGVAAFEGGGLSSGATSLSSGAQAVSTVGSIFATYASYERRAQEWEFQRGLAEQDVGIGAQQVAIATAQVQVAQQEGAIAQMQAMHAVDTVTFLATKFTNVDLYDWMSGVLGQVYAFFLRQATAMAQLAADQLAFERQEVPPPFIQADYWEAPSDAALGSTPAGTGTPTDRRGLTGSARLLQDIYQLDQYAFATTQRKLQLSKTFSLASLFPAEFQRFRETGVLRFSTSSDLFDRDFPGQYLRLIERVRSSVIALVPPAQGIRATLATTGISRVVIGGDIYQTVIRTTDPQLVALSAPLNATGLFEFEQQSDLLRPFEGLGVETAWELRMPRAANLLVDYHTLADVLLTIEFTALYSPDYGQQVIQALRPTLSADRPFSFRHELADQWYDLHNPDQTATPMSVRFSTTRDDFPPNLDELTVQHVALYVARAGQQPFEVLLISLSFTESGTTGTVGGDATPIEGLISTRSGNAGGWMALIGKHPVGAWELALPNTAEMRQRFAQEEIDDLLFVLTYAGRPPAWPA